MTINRQLQLALISCIIIILLSCQKEEITSFDSTAELPSITLEEPLPAEEFTGSTIPFDLQYPEVSRRLERLISKINSRDAYFDFSNIDIGRGVYVESESSDLKTFSYLLPTIAPDNTRFYNLVFEQIDGVYFDPYVLEFEMSLDFASLFNVSNHSFDGFEGWIRKYAIEEIAFKEGRNDEMFEFCYELLFGDSAGGHGVFTNNGTDPPSTNTGDSHSFSTSYCIECRPCSCENHNCGYGACICGWSPGTWRWAWVVRDCGSDRSNAGNDDGRGTYEECLRILQECGVVTPPMNGEVPEEEEEPEQACSDQMLSWMAVHNVTILDAKNRNVDFSICCTDGGFDLECAKFELTPWLLEQAQEVLDDMDGHYQSTSEERVYFNKWGYNGVAQVINDIWFYHRNESWYDANAPLIHWKYVGKRWIKYTPNETEINEMHFIEAIWDVMKDSGHDLLDLVGMVPVAGEVADGVNASWYFAEGDIVNGSISTAAMVPFVGVTPTAARLVKNTLKLSDKIFLSPKGLQYARRNYSGYGEESALRHVLRHHVDYLEKKVHGVFYDKNNIVGIIDDGYEKYLNGADVLLSTDVGDRTIIVVEMFDDIGWEGGWAGTNEAITRLKIVIEKNTNNVITAYPVKEVQ